jgi:hypothetical protein
MANTIKIKRSDTVDTPTSLQEGELAYSTTSKNLFIGTNAGVDIETIGGKIGTTVQGYSADTVVDSSYVRTANDFTTTLKNKLDGVADSANNYSLPLATDSVAGGIKVGDNLTITDGVLKAVASTELTDLFTSDSSTIALSAKAGKNLDNQLTELRKGASNTYAFKHDRKDGLRFDFETFKDAVTPTLDKLALDIVINPSDANYKLSQYLLAVSEGFIRGDITGDGEIGNLDTIAWLRYVAGYPDVEAFDIEYAIVNPIVENPAGWPEYFTPAFVDTESLIPAANITEGTNTTFVTAAERTKWDAAATWHGTMTSADEDDIVNTVQELIAVFDGAGEDLSVVTALGAKLDSSSTLDGGTFG